MGRLTTHVLDTANGLPGAGLRIDLFRCDATGHLVRPALCSIKTNNDGRCDTPLLQGSGFTRGEYELVFYAGDYFDAQGQGGAKPRFLDHVHIRFGVSDPALHYHVPLLISPFGYSTYRGS